jgi:hypothetical protein
MGIRIVSAISIWRFPALFLRSTFHARFTQMGQSVYYSVTYYGKFETASVSPIPELGAKI